MIDGGAGNDQLAGGNGSDALVGGDGADVLAGNAGADTLTGGTGADTFSFRISASFFAPVDSTLPGLDVVTDFEGAGAAGGDVIALAESTSRRMVFEGALAAMPAMGASVGFGGNGFTEVFYAADGGDTVLFADSNDDGVLDAGDFAVRFTGQHAFIAADFGTTPFVSRGSDGNDTIAGTSGNDTIYALAGNDTVSGGAGNDTVDAGAGNDVVDGDSGDDRLIGGAGNDALSGGDGRDRITGDDGNDLIRGGAGNDTVLSGGAGNDTVYGDEGNDTLDGDDGNDKLYGGAGRDDLFGGDGNDALYGEDGDDFVEGLDGNDLMYGGAGDDELIGDAGADVQSGGAGEDEFTFFLGGFNPSSPFAAHDTVLDFEGAGAAAGDEITIREHLVFRGALDLDVSAGAALPGAANGLTDLGYTIRGGDTWLIADDNDDGLLDAADFVVRFVGEHRFDESDFPSTDFVIVGTDADDALAGTDGDDLIHALGGNDSVDGLDGNDAIYGGGGDDVLLGGLGYAFDDLYGEDGNDTLVLQGEFGGNAYGGAGDDVLIGSDGLFSFTWLEGGAGNDTLRAGAGGAALVDFEGGNDRLEGGANDDQYTGGAGVDVFVFGTTWSSFRDILWDFEDGVEHIDLTASGLAYGDLTITDDGFGFSAIVSSSAGSIEIYGMAGQIDAADFLFA